MNSVTYQPIKFVRSAEPDNRAGELQGTSERDGGDDTHSDSSIGLKTDYAQ